MSRRPRKQTPRITPEAKRELDRLAERVLAGDEALEIRMMQKVFGKPIETELEPLPFSPMPEDEIPRGQEPGA